MAVYPDALIRKPPEPRLQSPSISGYLLRACRHKGSWINCCQLARQCARLWRGRWESQDWALLGVIT